MRVLSLAIIVSLPFAICYLLFAGIVMAGPNSSHFELKEYGFGAGGTASSSSESYSMFGTAGEVESGQSSSDNFKSGNGLAYTLNTNVPGKPTLSNPSDYYNKLKIVLDTANNPSDTKYAIAISDYNFTTVKYVQNDHSIQDALNADDWQDYTSWGGASGITILGLSQNKTYKARVSAMQGTFTQSPFGPASDGVATEVPSISYAINIGPTYPGTPTSPPYTLSIGSLTPNNVITSPDKVWIDFATNGTSGGNIYLNDNNTGLLSQVNGHTINAVNNNLDLLSEGYGAQGTDVSETSGGPMHIATPYDGSTTTVGKIDTTKQIIFDSSNSPVTGGRAAFVLKAKSSDTTPASSDYTDTLTVIVSASY